MNQNDCAHIVVTSITSKGMAYLWVADHIRPEWLKNLLLKVIHKCPLWVFKLIGIKPFYTNK